MFHVGKVLRVFKASEKEVIGDDSTVQAMLVMWDENLLTVSVKAGIGSLIKENDIVLVDYSPSSANIPVPKQVATKILRGETAKKTWKEYADFFERKKREQEFSQPLTNVR
jgi:hypothetical protein